MWSVSAGISGSWKPPIAQLRPYRKRSKDAAAAAALCQALASSSGALLPSALCGRIWTVGAQLLTEKTTPHTSKNVRTNQANLVQL